MFFKQVLNNSKKHRKDNSLFFATLLIAIVAFYTLLSLESQDVMRFLKTLEGDAIGKLMMLIPLVYMVSLFFVFFLVYFAYSYQMENRRREFGLCLMLGMTRTRLFLMLMCETILNSILSILAGIPIALLLTETISLATARLIGLGIIGHEIAFSASAIAGTIGGFFLVQLLSMFILSVRFCRMEPAALLRPDTSAVQAPKSVRHGILSFFCGILFLAAAYILGITTLHSLHFLLVLLVLVFGCLGTFLLYRGLGAFIGRRIEKSKTKQSGLYTFTGRQIQENILHQHSSLAVSSLLLLLAMTCISFGIGMGIGRGNADRSCDFSLMGSETAITEFVNNAENRAMIETSYPLYLDSLVGTEIKLSSEGLIRAIETVPPDAYGLRDNIIENVRQRVDEYQDVYLIPTSSFNALLKSVGEPVISLTDEQIAVYSGMSDGGDFADIFSQALESGAYVEQILPDNSRRTFEIIPQLYYNNIVADRAITIYLAFIVPDELYEEWTVLPAKSTMDSGNGSLSENASADESAQAKSTPFCWNIRLSEDLVEENGLLSAIMQMDERLTASGLEYDSYLGGIGRNLFYTVASSYLSIYLGVLFLLIANTVLVLKYLIWQKQNRRRYLTLLMLGADIADISRSMDRQILLYFLMVLGVAACNSVFAVWTMFTSFMKLPADASLTTVVLLTCIAFVCFILAELVYISIVRRGSRREILSLHVSERIEN